jgi:hypothetical protein
VDAFLGDRHRFSPVLISSPPTGHETNVFDAMANAKGRRGKRFVFKDQCNNRLMPLSSAGGRCLAGAK